MNSWSIEALTLKMLEEKHITLRQAAEIIGMSLEEMIDLISYTDIRVVDYESSELGKEMNIGR
ncbi:MAG: hypothetical protein BGO67_08905 [Alphaproteobacteria bacterium 41-28]|nr:MAG: hypothetical protein BGO67_08905 [Alphaproteobacteria bacterium 41-28]